MRKATAKSSKVALIQTFSAGSDYPLLPNDNEYKIALNKKLKEETKEYITSGDIRELADILEVVEAIAVSQGSTFDDVLKIKKLKANKNGKFEKKYYLESVSK